MKGGLILHPSDTHIIYPLGSSIVVKNVEADEQVILHGHNDRVTCMAITSDGNTLASGQITEMELTSLSFSRTPLPLQGCY